MGGQYCLYAGTNRTRLIPYLVSTVGALKSDSNPEEEVVLGNISNKAATFQLVMVNLSKYQGTTVHIKNKSFTMMVQARWMKGVKFKSDNGRLY